jgi:predicted nicotinamide N-methyase
LKGLGVGISSVPRHTPGGTSLSQSTLDSAENDYREPLTKASGNDINLIFTLIPDEQRCILRSIAVMFSMETFHQQYQTEQRELAVGERSFRFLVPVSLEPFVDPENLFKAFPLWAKIWEASLILANRLSAMPPLHNQRWLELGAGLGVVGIVAATFQHDVTITEFDRHALDFIRANAHLNDCTPRSIRRLDWTQPDLDTRFDRIVGSELIYNEKDFPALRTLFLSLLKPDGEILLAGEVRQTSAAFLDLMKADFQIAVARNTLRSEAGSTTILLTRLRPKAPLAT